MKTISLLKPLAAVVCALPLLVCPAQALNVTPADGGTGISADTAANAAVPAWTTLGTITLAEQGSNRGDIGAGTFVLQAPEGFEFNTAVTPSISFVNARNITAAAIAVTASNVLTITLSVNGSNALDTLTIGSPVAIQVRPVDGAGLASGSLHRPVTGGSAVLIDVTPGPGGTSFGGLSTKAGTAHHLAVQAAPTTGAVGVVFATQPVVQVRDQFANVLSAANGNADNTSVITATLGSGVGLLQGTTAATAGNGIAAFTNLASTNAGSLTLSFNSPGLVGATAGNLVVSPGPAIGLGFATQPGSVSYGLPLNPQPAVQTVDAFGNFSTVGLPPSRLVTLTLTAGTGSLLGTTALDIGTTAGNGMVSYFGLGVSAVGPGKQLTAIADGLTSGVSSSFEIAPLKVNGAVTVSHRTYDGTTNATILTRSLSGVLPGQTAILTGGTASFVTKTAGAGKTVVVTGMTLTGTHAENYQLATNAIYTTANIAPAPLTVNASNQVRTYGATNAPLTVNYVGLVGGETEANSGITGTAALATTAGTNSSPGTYPITLSAGTLTSQNYSFTSFSPGTVTVTKSPLIVGADNQWKVAGAANPPLTYSFLGLMNGESPAVISGAPGLSTTAVAGSPLGAYPITVTLGTLASANYAFTLVNGTLSVTPAGTLWHDEFSRPTEPGKMTPWIVQSGAWNIREGILEGGTNALNTYGIVRITNTWTDYAVQARVRFPTNAYGGGVGGRLQEANGTRYVAWLYPENSSGGSNQLKLLKFHTWNAFGYSNVAARAMQQVAVPPVGTNWHTLRLAFQGNRIGILLDGVRLINVVDTELQPYASGAVTLEHWTETNSYAMHFDDVRVSVPAGPVALDDSYTVATTSVLKVPASGVLGNDVADALELTAQLVNGPAHGTVTLTNNGGFTYTPAAPYTGPDSFTYRASDGSAVSAEATVHITVINNSAPAATPDAYTAMSGVPLIVNAPGVLANDSDPDGQVLTASLLAGPTNGTLTLNSDGAFTYTSAIGYNGTDGFTYRANDGMASSGAVTVSLTVTPAAVLFTDSFVRATDPGTFAPWIPQAGN
ncbi:MAG TPA: Ig-like domain-containing protein, partial [Clostridia bacterium]|nr:Ig-like domain-containing protein [Clostridia bacterium]